MTEFEFLEDDPRTGAERTRRDDPTLQKFADALRANPGRWAKYPLPRKSPSNLASAIRNDRGCPQPFRGGGFDAVSRDGAVYVCWVKND